MIDDVITTGTARKSTVQKSAEEACQAADRTRPDAALHALMDPSCCRHQAEAAEDKGTRPAG